MVSMNEWLSMNRRYKEGFIFICMDRCCWREEGMTCLSYLLFFMFKFVHGFLLCFALFADFDFHCLLLKWKKGMIGCKVRYMKYEIHVLRMPKFPGTRYTVQFIKEDFRVYLLHQAIKIWDDIHMIWSNLFVIEIPDNTININLVNILLIDLL